MNHQQLNDEASKRYKRLQDACSSEEGKLILKFLVQEYAAGSALAKTCTTSGAYSISTEGTFYLLGQKELVQRLVSFAKRKAGDDDLDVLTELSVD
jgi:hypothetical protein